jgi:RNA polymerase sigma-70 factor (ECF subfamily)
MSTPIPPAGGPSDEELMERVQSGDAAAYRALFERHGDRVFGYLSRLSGDAERGADLTQETFLRVWRARATWTPGRAVRPWIFGIAANAARDAARARGRRPVEVELSAHDAPAGGPVPGQARDLERALRALPDPLREAFLLAVVEGLDHNELARQLQISPDNARARVSRARAALRRALDEGAP